MMKRNEIRKAYGSEYKENTRRLLDEAGLCGRIKDRGNPGILIKPNLFSCVPAEFGATTHTGIIAGIMEYLLDNGLRDIVIAEGSWVGDRTEEAFDILGYRRLSEYYGVRLLDTKTDGFYTADCSGLSLKICNIVRETGFLINVPVLKGHCQTKVTCALKNMKGLIPDDEKRHFHTMGLHRPIACLNTHIRQDFIVTDHICGDPDFEEGGNPVQRDCVMAALDPVLNDAYAAQLLGYQPEEIEYIRLSQELGTGCADPAEAEIRTICGEEREELPRTRRMLEVSYDVRDIDSCSACYSALTGALERLEKDGLSELLSDRICIGQGWAGKKGRLGVGNCTGDFEINIPGCPPDADAIYRKLRELAEYRANRNPEGIC